MRIALLTDGIFPYVIGGMQKHSYFLVKELVRQGHTVYLFHCNETTLDASALTLFTAEEKKYIKPFLLPFPHTAYYPFHYLHESYLYSSSIYKALEPLLPDTDFIFAQGFCAWALIEKHGQRNEKRKSLPPVAVHFHGLEMFQHIPSFKAAVSRYPLQRAVKINMHGAEYSISYGGGITAIMEKIIGKDKIWEIPAGVESKWLNPSPLLPVTGKIRFVFVGRYERRKGIAELNRAIKILLADPANASFSFSFIGDIPPDERLTAKAVTYHGKISSEKEMADILRGCDVLVCPSYAEGMPNVILEAMACGLAVIATAVGAVPMLVDASNGWLIDSPLVSLITAAMQEAMKDDRLVEKKKASVEKIKNQFLIEKVTALLIKKMETACTLQLNPIAIGLSKCTNSKHRHN